MTEVCSPAGRLVTLRVTPPLDDAGAVLMTQQMRSAVVAIPGRAIICVDVSAARTFSPATTEHVIAMMRASNAKVERAALLLGAQGATLSLQVERMLRAAGHTQRQIFRERPPLRAWLAPLLTPPELAALDRFLAP